MALKRKFKGSYLIDSMKISTIVMTRTSQNL
jgi:hypothetical protein